MKEATVWPVHSTAGPLGGLIGTEGDAPFAGDSCNDPEVLVHAEDISILAPPGICDDEVYLVPTHKYRLLRKG